jgi:hypothetical protein
VTDERVQEPLVRDSQGSGGARLGEEVEAGAARLELLAGRFDGDRAGAAAAIRSFVLEALHVDARIVDLCLAQPHRLAALMRGLGAVCRAGSEGDAGADALLHALLAQLHDGVLRIPGLDRWRGYGSVTVQAIQEAADAGNLSREGIINAVRNIDYSASLLRDGLNYSMNAADGYIAEGTQLTQWDGTGFTDVGEVVDLEGSLGVYGG